MFEASEQVNGNWPTLASYLGLQNVECAISRSYVTAFEFIYFCMILALMSPFACNGMRSLLLN
jgi:hypothetical protein